MKLRGYLSLANLNKLIRDYSVNVRNIDSASAKANAKDGMMFNNSVMLLKISHVYISLSYRQDLSTRGPWPVWHIIQGRTYVH